MQSIRAALLVVTVLASYPQVAAYSDSTHYVQVVVDGVGDTPQAAVRNAGENGLKKVLGSYVDSETILTKRSEERDGERSSEKNLEEKYREYSRGVLKDIERISIVNEGGIYRAVARVTIKIIE